MMTNPSSPACPTCGGSIPRDAVEQLCPGCLMAAALAEPEPDTIALTADEPTSTDAAAFPRDFGPYRLLGLLGRGGMGTVYEAEHRATARRVALKVLGRGFDSPDLQLRFLREGRLAAGVSHPNSLYVFGTEEIAGRPVIAMEIAGGGTLNDRLKADGPFPVARAVDAILDVVAGLEAAFAAGVLHRDVKPSNCFVGVDGSVKIGDFGLSVSTLANEDSHLTGTGVVLGTPAFAAPEQLRGRDLDVRADIYSVGATLFTLLTGRPPIEGQNAIEVVAAVLEEKPRSLAALRDDVPAGLAQVVARCLAKKPEQRVADYASLRASLLPFGSARPEPAPLGRRLLASFIDAAVCTIVPSVLLYGYFQIDTIDEYGLLSQRTPAQVIAWVGIMLFGVVYYALFEGRWGAAVGKTLMGFRVSRPGGRAPGIARAAVRGAVVTSVHNVGRIICLTAMTSPQFVAHGTAVASIGNLLTPLLVLATMRRRNGFATAWDLLTGTRVVIMTKGAVRPRVRAERRLGESPARRVWIGPYETTAAIVPDRWIAAHDPALRRDVWLRRATSPPPPDRRDLARPGRLRWLQGVETPAARWDVYEAPPGVPFRQLASADAGLTWEATRHWLHDLAMEIDAAARGGTLPSELSVDHVWITTHGRAVLLDDPWPDPNGPAERIAVREFAGRQRFLQRMAADVNPVTVPLHARPLLESLAAGSFDRLSFVGGNLRALLAKPARIDRRLRAASLFAIPLFIIATVTVVVIGFLVTGRPLGSVDRDLWAAARDGDTEAIEEHACLLTDLDARDPAGGETPLIVAARRGHAAAVGLLVDLGADPVIGDGEGATPLHIAARCGHVDTTKALLERGVDPTMRDHAGRTPLDVAVGRQPRIAELLRDSASSTRPPDRSPRVPKMALAPVLIPLGLATVAAVIQLLTLIALRATPGHFLFGLAVVDARGMPARRPRLLLRWLIAWVFPVSMFAWLVGVAQRPIVAPWDLLPLVLLIPWCAALVVAVRRPTRGVAERWSGCWLVTR